jgi:hypothetical protein
MATVQKFNQGWGNFGSQDRQEMLRDDMLAGKSVSFVLFSVIGLGTLAMALVTVYILLTS